MLEEYPHFRCFQRYTYVCETISFGASIPVFDRGSNTVPRARLQR